MNIARLRLPGFWTIGSVVSPAEFEAFDEIRPWLINASGGSTHGGGLITLGNPVTITGPFQADDAEVTIPATKTITVEPNGTITLQAETMSEAAALLDVLGALIVRDGASVTFQDGAIVDFNTGSEVSFFSGFTVKNGAVATVASGGDILVEPNGDLYIQGNHVITSGGAVSALSGSTVSLAGTTTQTGAYVKSGNNATTSYRRVNTTDADHDFNATVDIVKVPRTRTADRTYTLKQTSPVPPTDSKIHFVCDEAPVDAFKIDLVSETAGNLAGSIPGSARAYLTVRYDGTKWLPLDWSNNITWT